jgi:hypothetical protein
MLKNKVLVLLTVASSISSAFAAKTSSPQVVAAGAASQCISMNSQITFVAKNATVDSNSIQAGSQPALVDNLSNNSGALEKSDYSNSWNSAPSDASVNLQKMPNGGLNGSIVLTEIRKNLANAELQQKYGSASSSVCVTGIALSLIHADDALDGGNIMLYLNTGDSIDLQL